MRRYGCLQAIPMSFYSRNLYRDVAKNWAGGVILYLILVLAIAWVFLSLVTQKNIGFMYQQFSGMFLSQIPVMTLEKGQLKTPENRPYLIKDEKKQIVAIIDTSGKYQNLDNTSAKVLVTKSLFYYRDHSDVQKTQPFAKDITLQINPTNIDANIKKTIPWMWLGLLPAMLFFSFIYRIIQAALYAIIGKVFAVFSYTPLTYGEIFKITIFALTPTIIIGAILSWFTIFFPYSWLFYFILSIAYLIFGIYANKPEKR